MVFKQYINYLQLFKLQETIGVGYQWWENLNV